MKSNLVYLILATFCQAGFGQGELCDAVVYWKHEGEVVVYTEPGGSILILLQNNTESENYISMQILSADHSHFQVEIKMEMTGSMYSGWIEKTQYIGAFMKHETEFMDLTLYQEPDVNSPSPIRLDNWKAGFVTIEACGGEWSRVSVFFEGKRVSGWIESQRLCANNYTSCS